MNPTFQTFIKTHGEREQCSKQLNLTGAMRTALTCGRHSVVHHNIMEGIKNTTQDEM